MDEHSAGIARDFPDMPQDIQLTWLAPHAARHGFGWPPDADGTQEPWSAVLGGRPVSWWQDQIWVRESLPMDLAVMSHTTRFHVERLVTATLAGRDYLEASLSRVSRVSEFLVKSGTWPVAPVAFPDPDGRTLIDGFHRLAALELARRQGIAGLSARHEVWIALPLSVTAGQKG